MTNMDGFNFGLLLYVRYIMPKYVHKALINSRDYNGNSIKRMRELYLISIFAMIT